MKLVQKTLVVAMLALGSSVAFAQDFSTEISGQVTQSMKDAGNNNEQSIKIAKGTKISGGGSGSVGFTGVAKKIIGIDAQGAGGGGVSQSMESVGDGNKQKIEIGGSAF